MDVITTWWVCINISPTVIICQGQKVKWWRRKWWHCRCGSVVQWPSYTSQPAGLSSCLYDVTDWLTVKWSYDGWLAASGCTPAMALWRIDCTSQHLFYVSLSVCLSLSLYLYRRDLSAKSRAIRWDWSQPASVYMS